jgi:hypothetical protein
LNGSFEPLGSVVGDGDDGESHIYYILMVDIIVLYLLIYRRLLADTQKTASLNEHLDLQSYSFLLILSTTPSRFASPGVTNIERLRRSGTKTVISCFFFITKINIV